MLELLASIGLALAGLPFVMTLLNLRALAGGTTTASRPSVAILVPARNEESTIGACVEAALASRGAEIRVVVADDGSADRTAEIVAAIAARDGRVRLVRTPALPAGWNGKQHACHVLAGFADAPFLLFVDADVRLAPGAAARLAARLEDGRFGLVSGVPRQIMEGFWELLLIPMINALLLGYLPVAAMRRLPSPGLGAACGQMIMVRRDAYEAAGGHAAIRASMHDGLKLPRAFRRAGLMTDLIDGAPLASCRMYRGGAQTRAGFAKNATEGLATPRALPVWTLLLFGGHVLPWALLPFALATGSTLAVSASAAACALPLAARALQAWRCREPAVSVLLHPAAVLATLALQWIALLRHLRGAPTSWRGRSYQTGV